VASDWWGGQIFGPLRGFTGDVGLPVWDFLVSLAYFLVQFFAHFVFPDTPEKNFECLDGEFPWC